jgi:hypothetical protein
MSGKFRCNFRRKAQKAALPRYGGLGSELTSEIMPLVG